MTEQEARATSEIQYSAIRKRDVFFGILQNSLPGVKAKRLTHVCRIRPVIVPEAGDLGGGPHNFVRPKVIAHQDTGQQTSCQEKDGASAAASSTKTRCHNWNMRAAQTCHV